MLLITFHEWNGMQPQHRDSEESIQSSERTVAFTSALSLQDSLKRVQTYCYTYRSRFKLATEYRLLSVVEIPAVDQDLLDYFGATRVEALPQRTEDFG